jgi:hypothetical protein
MPREPTLGELRALARYHRDRLAGYRTRILAGTDTTLARLRELERAAASSHARLHRALERSRLP